ncbi:MAG: transporter substrate-binding domain-containing protein, partial [Cytophagales bacterium]|nr:transporter substrate-binding domain-containing protein [Cytophagales bacterium]
MLLKIQILILIISTVPSTVFSQNKNELPAQPNHAQETNGQIQLTKKERVFLQSHPVIRFGTDETWEPYVMKADGTLRGLDVDFLNYINKTTGANIQLVIGEWADMVEKAKKHEIDGLASSTPRKERAPYFNFSGVYVSDFFIIILPSDNTLN